MNAKCFSKKEYENRWKRAGEIMASADVDALLVTWKYNYGYLSGHMLEWDDYTRAFIFVLSQKHSPITIVHSYYEAEAERASWAKDLRVFSDLLKGPLELIKNIIQELELSDGRIGLELGYEQRLGVPYSLIAKLKKYLPKANFVDASEILWMLRTVKSRAEIKLIRSACEITSKAFETCFNTISEGMNEREVTKILFSSMIEEGADKPHYILISSGPYNYQAPGGGSRDFTLKRGNIVWIDTGCIYKNYNSDFARRAVIGKPSDKQRRMHEIASKTTRTCINEIKPGIRVSEIAKTCYIMLKKRGLPTPTAGRIGHGLGLALTEPPHVALYDNTILKPGMVITIEPSIVTDYGCFTLENDIVVTEDSCEILSVASDELKII